ncbi:DUF4286 family protein [Paraburkholderia caribensis]|uniref:DUF4286 family protein n=1 Tax=Paraburkholderia caribensis TaxID=75105 RepID=UPI001CB315AB|nr:DUF4286 family protein [Paraburkholderia caribensis]CAG9243798.1 conserved hypothetical protein [Paraburkholderia caribensis]
MSNTSKGLMAFWSDIEPSYIEEYRRWHNEEHMGERLAIPGFLTGQRYRVISGARMFLMYYETTSPQVLESDAYKRALNTPTEWTKKSLVHFKNPLRNLYREVSVHGVEAASASKVVLTARFDLPADESAVTPAKVAEKVATDGSYRTRCFELEAAATAAPTAERSIYGAQNESQRYLVIVEKNATSPADDPKRLCHELEQAGAVNAVVELFSLDFSMRAPAESTN